jgi:hypothetical protein
LDDGIAIENDEVCKMYETFGKMEDNLLVQKVLAGGAGLGLASKSERVVRVLQFVHRKFNCLCTSYHVYYTK